MWVLGMLSIGTGGGQVIKVGDGGPLISLSGLPHHPGSLQGTWGSSLTLTRHHGLHKPQGAIPSSMTDGAPVIYQSLQCDPLMPQGLNPQAICPQPPGLCRPGSQTDPSPPPQPQAGGWDLNPRRMEPWRASGSPSLTPDAPPGQQQLGLTFPAILPTAP